MVPPTPSLGSGIRCVRCAMSFTLTSNVRIVDGINVLHASTPHVRVCGTQRRHAHALSRSLSRSLSLSLSHSLSLTHTYILMHTHS